jgi:hypothetical protein
VTSVNSRRCGVISVSNREVSSEWRQHSGNDDACPHPPASRGAKACVTLGHVRCEGVGTPCSRLNAVSVRSSCASEDITLGSRTIPIE